MPKGFTVRLDDDQAAELEAIARSTASRSPRRSARPSPSRSPSDARTRSFAPGCASRSKTTRRCSSVR